MADRKKILIIQNDDFMRELLGNLLHKEGFYILNGSTVEEGLNHTINHHIDIVIISSDCPDYEGKSTFNYIMKRLETAQPFVIHQETRSLPYLYKDDQMSIDKFCIPHLIKRVSHFA